MLFIKEKLDSSASASDQASLSVYSLVRRSNPYDAKHTSHPIASFELNSAEYSLPKRTFVLLHFIEQTSCQSPPR